MKTIGEFELIDHRIEHFQYFQGCGIVHTNFGNVVTGIGDNPTEAIDNCLEQMAQGDFDTEGMEARIMAQEGWKEIPETPSLYDECDECEDDCNYCKTHYHMSIRWNEKKGT